MRRHIHTHNLLRLGDNIIQLNFLRRVLEKNDVEITHYYSNSLCNGAELVPFIAGLEDRITLSSAPRPPGSIDSWRGPDWYGHPDKLNFSLYHKQWFAKLSASMGVVNPIVDTDDLLIDYPLLHTPHPKYDVVVLNSPALSGQFTRFSDYEFNYLITMLLNKNYSVITTRPTDLCPYFESVSVAHIGAVAANADVVVGVSTGVSWPCFNIINKNALHIMLLDYESVILTPRGRTVKTVYEAINILQQENIL